MLGKLKEKLQSFIRRVEENVEKEEDEAKKKGLLDKILMIEIKEKDIEEALEDLELELLEADVALEVVDELKDRIKRNLVGKKVRIGTNKEKIIEEAVRKAVLEILTPEKKMDLLEEIKKLKSPT